MYSFIGNDVDNNEAITWEHSVRVYSDAEIGITLEAEDLPDNFLELAMKS